LTDYAYIFFWAIYATAKLSPTIFSYQEPRHANAFIKSSILLSTKTKQNIFAYTAIFVSFFCANAFSVENAHFLMRFLKRQKTLMVATLYDTCSVTLLKSLRFHLERFQNDAISKGFTFNIFCNVSLITLE